MIISVEQLYTSVACNRTPEITDWNSDGLICFGATNAVVIYNTNQVGGDPLTVLAHHISQVNSVKWLYKPDGTCSEFVSCSADKTAAIWTFNGTTWEVTSKLTGHTDGVTCVFGIYTGDDLEVYTGSIDSTIKVWQRKNGETTLKQTISLNYGLCLTFHAHLLPGADKPVLFCALDDHKIHLFAGDEEYHRVHTLVGHEDWVRGLDVLDVDDTTIILASASQDTYIRLWRIQQHEEVTSSTEIRVEEKVFHAHGRDWAVKLDAVLAGHEGWVYGVQWHPYAVDPETNKKVAVYRLLSSSLDKTLIVWEAAGAAGAWAERVRAGEVGGGGLGFYGSRFGPAGDRFMGHGYNGSFHIWKLNKETEHWEPQVVCGGHFGEVEDVRWEPRGRYIISASADQTTRLHAPWTRNVSWHEVSRAQVHGYSLAALAPLRAACFASAADEKVLRVFTAPHNFLTNFRTITGEDLDDDGEAASAPEGASVPSLGLSNKAVFRDAPADPDDCFVPVTLTEPPTEETLMQNTLWAEAHKLYGHGYEAFALAAAADARLLASACRATCADHAAVLLWETTTWQQIQKLVSHQLTVTQLAFSPDSQNLVSVSRDRRWTLYRRREGSDLFDIAASTDKTNGVHTRIIWCCAWAHDNSMFATGSRDGKICVWAKTESPQPSSLKDYALLGSNLEVKGASVTAVAFAPLLRDGCRLLAAGFESGRIALYSYSSAGWSLLYELNNSAAHHLTVRRLEFRPLAHAHAHAHAHGRRVRVALASAGADRLVRLHDILVS